MKTKKTKPIRPIHIFLFMLSCMAALAVMCILMPQESNWVGNIVRSPQLEQVLELSQDSTDDQLIIDDVVGFVYEEPIVYDTICVVDSLEVGDTINAPVVVTLPTASATVSIETVSNEAVSKEVSSNIDTRIYLSEFYNGLKRTNTESLRVVHYGDSQIEEDRLTTQIRRALQNQYGGGGVGILPLHQTIPTRTIWQTIIMNNQVQQTNQGPKRYLAYGPKSYRRSNSVYGPMGQVAVMDNQLVAGSEDIVMQINGTGKNKNIESYFNRIRILKSGNISVSIERATDRHGDVFIVPDSTSSATIHFTGKGDIYGICLEKNKGVTVDNIPMRGCTGAIFTSCAPSEVQDYFANTNTRLIILQYGGNIMPYTTTKQQVAQYVYKMQTQVQYLKYLAPNSSIVFVGPSDMIERRDGQLQTYRMIPVVDQALEKMAIEEEIGYFSLYQHMGGKGSMIEWKEKGWASGDYVHFTRKGAEKAGQMLAEWLIH